MSTKAKTPAEQQVYRHYRNMLRLQRGGHAAQRRQAARKLTVDRYNVTYVDVKRIVAEQDALNGVVHASPLTADKLQVARYNLFVKEWNANPIGCACENTELVRPRLNQRSSNPEFVVNCLVCDMKARGELPEDYEYNPFV